MTNRKHSVGVWVAGSMFAVVMYVLSSGPARWLLCQGPNIHRADLFYTVYFPVFSLCKRSESLMHAFEVYLAWWGENPEWRDGMP